MVQPKKGTLERWDCNYIALRISGRIIFLKIFSCMMKGYCNTEVSWSIHPKCRFWGGSGEQDFDRVVLLRKKKKLKLINLVLESRLQLENRKRISKTMYWKFLEFFRPLIADVGTYNCLFSIFISGNNQNVELKRIFYFRIKIVTSSLIRTSEP